MEKLQNDPTEHIGARHSPVGQVPDLPYWDCFAFSPWKARPDPTFITFHHFSQTVSDYPSYDSMKV
jgi:hypothetical protein